MEQTHDRSDAYSDLGGNRLPSDEDYIKSQIILNRTGVGEIDATKLLGEKEADDWSKLYRINYWQKLPPSKIKSNFDEVVQRIHAYDEQMDERALLLEEDGVDPSNDMDLKILAAKNEHWLAVKNRVESHPRFKGLLSGE